MTGRIPVFDLDGTLLDSDAALAAAIVALGVPAEEVTFGHTVAVECARLGVPVADYLAGYDVAAAQPFAGVDSMVRGLDRWAVCSNKLGDAARAELDRLGWSPTVALFAEDFDSEPKQLGPVLARLGVDGRGIAFVGDTVHDLRCARAVGCAFAVAGWNPRARADAALLGSAGCVLDHPADVVALLG